MCWCGADDGGCGAGRLGVHPGEHRPAGTGPGQNTGGDTPGKGDRRCSRTRTRTKYSRKYTRYVKETDGTAGAGSGQNTVEDIHVKQTDCTAGQGQDKIQLEILQVKKTYGTAGPGPGKNIAGDTQGKGGGQYSRITARTKLRRYSRYRRQTVQQDQGQDKIQQEILQIKETYGTAGSGAGQNTAGGSPGRGHRPSSRTRARR